MSSIFDFEGNELRLGDEVVTLDLDRYGSGFQRGEVVKLCKSTVKISISKVRHGGSNGTYTETHEVTRGDRYVYLIAHNPTREQELLNPPVVV